MESFVQNLPDATPSQASDVIRRAEAAPAPGQTPAGTKPGSVIERWPVKTGQDDDVGKIVQAIVGTTVAQMGTFARPSDWQTLNSDPPVSLQRKRFAPVETTVWRVATTVIGIRMESDGDYHLELQDDSGAMMIAEIPLPDVAYVGGANPFFSDIKTARDATDRQFQGAISSVEFVYSPLTGKLVPVSADGLAGADAQDIQHVDLATMTSNQDARAPFSTRLSPTKATITGVGFFDKDHGQTGNAPNILELHPVLSIAFG